METLVTIVQILWVTLRAFVLFLVDFGFSTADINMGYSLLLADRHVAPYDDLSHVWSYYQRLALRPAFQKAIN